MKLAILSDVHSNLQALEAVLAGINRFRPDMTVCAGDVVGYGAYPNECCRIIGSRGWRTAQGNHDRAVLAKDPSGANPYAAKAIIWTADIIGPETRRFLSELPTELRLQFAGRSISVFHGSPSSVEEYVYEADVDEDLLAEAHSDILILGHTHMPCVKRLENGLFINPGSVGQPRDHEWKASFAIFDAGDDECSIKRVSYDVDSAAKTIRDAGLPKMLAERLRLGI